MDFDFSPEQNALRDSVRDWLASRYDPDAVRATVPAKVPGVTVDDARWREIVELGWAAILLPESVGGLGLGLVDLGVVLEEMGKVPLPGPFLASAGYAARAAVLFDDEALQTALAAGETVGTVAVEELGVAGDPFATISTTASRDGDQWRLTGIKPHAVDGHVAEFVIVCARDGDGDGLAAFVVTEPAATIQPSLDPTRALARLELTGAPARRIGPAGDQTALWRRWADDAAVMMCAESVGACDRAFDVAGEYSKNRVQFGKPIGAFQAIKHLEAEMLQDLTLARVGVHYAAWASDVEAPEREMAAAMAKSWTGEAAVRVTSTAIQIHGGVGFTWDALVHLHYKRAKTNDLLLGRQGWQRQRVADLLLGPAPALI